MANVILPAVLARKISSREIGAAWPAQHNESNWTGGGKILLLAGIEKHRFKCQLRPLATENEIREARAFFYALKGQLNTFYLPYLPTPQNIGANTTVVAGGSVGSRVVQVASAAGVAPGMPISVTLPSGHKRLFIVISLAGTTLTVEPSFSESAALGAVVEVQNPVCRVRLDDSSFSYSDEMGRAGFSFEVTEAIEALDTGSEGAPLPPALPEGGLQIYDEGILQGEALAMDFVGPGVTASVDLGVATIEFTDTGGGGGTGEAGVNIGLFVDADTIDIDPAISYVETSGHATVGVGSAHYVYDASIDPTYVTANPYTSFLDVNGRGFHIDEPEPTPAMLGASGVNEANLALSVDVTARVQACIDLAFDRDAAPNISPNLDGHWAISGPLYLGRALLNTGELNIEYHNRRYRGGRFYILSGAVIPDAAINFTGPHHDFEGTWLVHDGGRGTSSYASRRYNHAFHAVQCANAHLGQLIAFGAKGDVLVHDARFETWAWRPSTVFETGSVSKNSIGMKVDAVFGAGCGSYHGFAAYGLSMAISSFDQGGVGVEFDPQGPTPETFDTNQALYGSSGNQRTKITVADASDIRLGSFGKVRTEIPAATFTSIAVDAATNTIIWTAGDPTTAGIKVGTRFQLIDGSSVGANDGKIFEAVSFSGTSNRNIKVKLITYSGQVITTETAKAYTAVYTDFTLHYVTQKSGNTFLVRPWIPDTTNSLWYAIHGCVVESIGIDTASCVIGQVTASKCGIGFRSAGLYGIKCEHFLGDHSEIGATFGNMVSGAAIGAHISHRHMEGCFWPFVQAGGAAVYGWHVGDGSGMVDLSGCISLGQRAQTSDPMPVLSGMRLSGGTFVDRGRTYNFHEGSILGIDSGNFTLSNDPAYSTHVVMANAPTVTVDFDVLHAMANNLARTSFLWAGSAGAAPTGTLTFSLSTNLSDRAWTILPKSTFTAVQPCLFEVAFDNAQKIVVIEQLGYRPLDPTGPWTAFANLSFTPVGGDDYLIATGTASLGQATFPIEDDFRMRIIPQQANKLIQVGLDNSGVTTLVDQQFFDAYLYLQADSGYGPYKAGYGLDTGGAATYSYAANDVFWIERTNAGKELRAYKGGPDWEDADLIWTFSMDTSGFDFARVMINNGSAKVKLFPPAPRSRKPITDATTARTLKLSDAERYIRFTNGSPITLTVPTNATVPFPIGTEVHGIMAGAGTVTIAGAGVTFNAAGADLTTNTQFSKFTLKKVATDTWDVYGSFA